MGEDEGEDGDPSAFVEKMLAAVTGDDAQQQWSQKVTVGSDKASAVEAAMAFWPAKFPSTSAAKKAVRRKMIRIDGELAKCGGPAVKKGQEMELKERRAQRGTDTDAADSLLLQMAYVDESVAVCIKPCGIPVDQQRDKTNSVPPSQNEYALSRQP